MKINEVQVDGFGVWTGLKLARLSDRITVLYGANEAGKTTLLQFLRAVLYGFTPGRRRKYLPPLRGGLPGGSLAVASTQGEFIVTRRADDELATDGDIAITAEGGAVQGATLLRVLLGDVDESIYNNVYAVGLREMQELGTLDDTEAGRWLYSLASGLDRVSLVDVMRELETSRSRILAADDRPSRVVQLLNERQRLEAEIEELGDLTHRWARLAAQRREVDADIAAIELEATRLDGAARLLETAIGLQEPWRQRAAIDEQLLALGPGAQLTDAAVEQLQATQRKLQRCRRRRAEIHGQRVALKEEIAALEVNDALWENNARIEALGEQMQWVAAIETQVREFESDVAQLAAQLPDKQRPVVAAEAVTDLTPKALTRLRSPARQQREAKKRFKLAEAEASRCIQSVGLLSTEIGERFSDNPNRDLTKSLEEAGERVNQLRRRIQVDERLEQLSRHQSELEGQGVDLLDRQLMPMSLVVFVGAMFVLGVLLIFLNAIFPTIAVGGAGWTFASLGLLFVAMAGATKWYLDHSAERNLDDCHRQGEQLERQLKQAKEERDALDRDLPKGGGPLAARLQTAEKELATLENLMPLQSRRQVAVEEQNAADQRLARCREEMQSARRTWNQALVSLGLEPNLSVAAVKQMASQGGHLAKVRRELNERRAELEDRRREYTMIATRVAQLIDETELTLQDGTLVEQIRQMLSAAAVQKGLVRRRQELRRQARDLKRKEDHQSRGVVRFNRRRKAILKELGAVSVADFRTLAADHAHARQLQRERELVCRQIAAALGQHASEEQVAALLAGANQEILDQRWLESAAEVEANRQRLRQTFEQRAELGQQQRTLGEDKRLADRQLELSMVNLRLEEALAQWQVRAVAGVMLEKIRQEFERHRQPETLVEASTYLKRLTGNHYTRVWTPLAHNMLYVDDRDGKSWAVDVLSRGTREQLFLSLRLALVSLFARRGVQLPLVLDDVLVNFDAERARAAAEVLCDFAAQGHQVLVFTCHEHVWQMFKSLKVDVRRLPNNLEMNVVVLPEQEPVRGRRARRFEPEPTPIVEEVVELEEPVPVEPPPVVVAESQDYELHPAVSSGPLWDDDEALFGALEEIVEPDTEIDKPITEPPRAVAPPPPMPTPAPLPRVPDPAPVEKHERPLGARGWEVELEEELKELLKKDAEAA